MDDYLNEIVEQQDDLTYTPETLAKDLLYGNVDERSRGLFE